MIKNFGPIYAKASNGKIKMWSARVEDNKLFTTHGYEDGKKVTDEEIIQPKNIGRANETTPFDQACSEAQSKYNKKIDKGYMTDITKVSYTEVFLPMLANKYSDKKHTVKFPCYVSPKLDGVRLVTKLNEEKKPVYLSRSAKEYTALSHLNKSVNAILTKLSVCDGEAFNPDFSLQEISSAVKKEREESKELEYWLFDIIDTKSPFSERYEKITKFFDKFSDSTNRFGFRVFGQIVEVPNYLVNNEEELEAYHKSFVELGFEGTMVRAIDGLYVLVHRSDSLLKRKDFLEEEFIITGGHEGTGNDIGTVIFECRTKDGKIFSVRPKGSRKLRRQWLQEIDILIGKQLTVRFQLWSNDNIPCQNRGICIRDYE
jgi:DNA ligase-1